MSVEFIYDLYGFRSLTLDDVQRAFVGGTVTVNATDAFDIRYEEFFFELFDATDVASPHFMRWVAEQEGNPTYTHAYRTYIEGYTDEDVWKCLTAVASSMNGIVAMMEDKDGAGYMTDDQVEYIPPTPDTAPVIGRALAMTWSGRLRMCEHPMAQWIRTCDDRFPDFTPDRFGFENRPITDTSKAWLTSPSSRTWDTYLWHSALLGPINFQLPYSIQTFRVPTESGTRTAFRIYYEDSVPDSLYKIKCTIFLDSVVERRQMDQLSDFFTGMARDLRAEVASCEVLDGYAEKNGLAEFTMGAEQEQRNIVSKDFALLGLFPAPVWWLWLGPDYSRLLNPWLQTAAPPSWNITTDDNTTLIRTSPTPARSEELHDGWLPREYLIRKNLFGKPRPAKTLPTWATT